MGHVGLSLVCGADMRRTALGALTALALSGLATAQAQPSEGLAALSTTGEGDVRLIGSVISRPGTIDVLPMCERTLGFTVSVQTLTNPNVKQAIESGGMFDVVLVEPDMLHELGAKGLVDVSTMTALASVRMAVLAKEGAPAVDTHDVEAFKRFLLSTQTVAYASDGFSGGVVMRTLERLGMSEVMKSRLVPLTLDPGGAIALRAGRVQYYMAPASTPLTGTQVVGAFPDEIQTYVGVHAAATPHARPRTKALLECLGSAPAQAIFKAKGYAPPM